ncbi:MAG TPA: hypothetical protein VFL91_15115, partial [Thermomicrobiales bacterium]|nr:hypothetical protein [Thermomicrobiales bacterium]
MDDQPQRLYLPRGEPGQVRGRRGEPGGAGVGADEGGPCLQRFEDPPRFGQHQSIDQVRRRGGVAARRGAQPAERAPPYGR